jgi:integrase
MEAWPEADRAIWERIIKIGNLLEEAGPGQHWRPETRRVAARDYGYWLTFVLSIDSGLARENPIARITPERVRAYCRAMEGLSALTKASRIARLYTIIRGADPARDLRWLAEIRRALERAARREGSAQRKHGRILPSGRLMDAGLALLKGAHLDGGRSLRLRAKDFRDGLMIALLAARPLRIKNFATLRLGHHLHETSSNYLIDIPADETKSCRPLETFVPDELDPWLAIYLQKYRPILLGGRQSDYLWVHATGDSYRPSSLAQRIPKLTKRLLGVAIGPHLFRDCAATTIATNDPGHVLIIASILGHTTLKTAENHYNHARSLEASRHFQNSIGQVREMTRPIGRRSLRS